MTRRPDNVPADWILRECGNPSCNRMVWLPPFFADDDLPVERAYGVCSAECAKAVASTSVEELTEEQLDDKIAAWHEGRGGVGMELHEWLGWSWDEYQHWVRTNEPKAVNER